MFIITSLHVITCVVLILVVLLQAGKGAGMGSALGGASQAFLDRGATSSFLTRATAIAAIIFMITSLAMGYIHVRNFDSVMNNIDTTSDLFVEETSGDGELEISVEE